MNLVLQLLPDRLDVNGDAQNALVLAQRARWAGIGAEVVPVIADERLPSDRPAAIVVGSSVDSELVALRADLADVVPALIDWVAAGVPLLAVGTGFELLSHGIQLGSVDEPGEFLEGFGLFAGRAQPLRARAADDLVVDAAEGRIVGFENHARGFLLPADAPAFGTVVRGTGNDSRSEGARTGSAIGTHLHGPVLARNPFIADAMLTAAFGDRYHADSEQTRRADSFAATARAAAVAKLELANSR